MKKQFRMPVLGRMKIAHKLYLSYGCVLSVLLLVGGISFHSMNQVQKNVEQLNVKRIGALSDISALDDAEKQINANLAVMLLSSAVSKEDISKLSASQKSFQIQLDNVAKNKADYFIKDQDMAMFSAYWKEYADSMSQIAAWLDKKPSAIASLDQASFAYKTTMSAKSNTMNALLNRWSRDNQKAVADGYQEITKLQTANKWTLAASAAIAALLSALLGFFMSRSVAKPLREMVELADEIADGRLGRRFETNREDEIGKLGRAFGRMSENISGLIGRTKFLTSQVSSASIELSASAEQMTDSSKLISSSIQEIASGAETQAKNAMANLETVKKTLEGVEEIAQTSLIVATDSAQTMAEAESGNHSVQAAAKRIQMMSELVEASSNSLKELEERSKKIGQILEVISSISSQTNLLALNAAIEAARAGDAGKGFSVVAQEVRKLAEQSARSTSEISAIVKEIQEGVLASIQSANNVAKETKSGVEAVLVAGEKFDRIAASVRAIAQNTKEVSEISEQLAEESQRTIGIFSETQSVAHRSAGHVHGIASSTEEQFASMVEMSESAGRLSEIAGELKDSTDKFDV